MSTQKESTTAKKTSTTAKNGEPSPSSKAQAISKVKQLTKQVTPDSRLSAINVLQKLADKVKYLRAKQDEVNLFVAESDNLNRTINLDNGKNIVLTVNNSVVVQKVLDLMTEELDSLTTQAEKELINFNI